MLTMLAFVLVGIGAIVWGVAMFSPAVALIVFGVFALAIGMWPILRRG